MAILLIFSLGLPVQAQKGALAWAKRAGGNNIDDGNGVAVDTHRNVYVTGYFKNTATFGSSEANQTAITSAGGSDIFVAKFLPGATTTQPVRFVGVGLLPNGNPEMTLSGTPLKTYTIRRAGTIAGPLWNGIGSISLDARGRGVFEDADEALVFPAFYQAVGD